jgi:hypothetical protein
VGLFSFLKKREDGRDDKRTDGKGRAAPHAPLDDPFHPDGPMRGPETTRLMTDAERARQREIARATAAKIDAIETAMVNDIFNVPEPAWGSAPRRPRTQAQIAQEASGAEAAGPATLPALELSTTALLADDEVPDTPAAPQTPPVLEEIAILYANGELAIAEQMLREHLQPVGKLDRSIWWMLFDLYQVSARQDDFESLAIDYASQFETSPPAWNPPLAPIAQAASAAVAPTEALGGVLDGHIAPALERLVAAAASHPLVRLEIAAIDDITPEGCALLLGALDRLQRLQADQDGLELVLAGSAELGEVLRPYLAVGDRSLGEAPWQLLLRLYQLMNREKEFEELAMDFCITFEISPPSFEAPHKVTNSPAPPRARASERFLLPAVVQGASSELLAAIDAYAADTSLVVLDASRLTRIDFAAAGALLATLRPLAADKRIEIRDLNHLVAALLKLVGVGSVARLFPHKY